jgi:hypothetical protein
MSSASQSTVVGVTKRDIAQLLGRRRQNLSRDGHIADDRVSFTRDEDGHKIGKVMRPKPGTKNQTIERDRDLTALEGAVPSTTSNLEVLRTEARQASEATDDELESMNPHIPSNDGVLETIAEELAEKGLAPAWEVVDGIAEVTNG